MEYSAPEVKQVGGRRLPSVFYFTRQKYYQRTFVAVAYVVVVFLFPEGVYVLVPHFATFFTATKGRNVPSS